MMDEAASRAERIRASRGNSEVEVTCTGEKGLHQCEIMCPKNSGHENFIPTKKFDIKHLPDRFRDDDIVGYVRATSDVTCRLSVSHISEDRPETWPDSNQAFPFSANKGENSALVQPPGPINLNSNLLGTGWLSRVIKFTEKDNRNCSCNECHEPGIAPKKTWGELYVDTARHVVYNNEEAKRTKCQFFYDSHDTDINEVLTLTGLKDVSSDIKGDWCRMKYVTHDVELLDRFDELYRRWDDLRCKVTSKHLSSAPSAVTIPGVRCDKSFNVDRDLCIIVSHPHGCAKVISVGTWTRRHVEDKDEDGDEKVTYSYNTPTCPGSSGAPVITLYKDNMWPVMFYHLPPHSQGGPGNDNKSGKGCEDYFNY